MNRSILWVFKIRALKMTFKDSVLVCHSQNQFGAGKGEKLTFIENLPVKWQALC